MTCPYSEDRRNQRERDDHEKLVKESRNLDALKDCDHKQLKNRIQELHELKEQLGIGVDTSILIN